jgi:hypothetical protein
MALAKQTVPRPPDMEKFEIYAAGYKLPLVTDSSGDTVENERGYRVFGRDGELSYLELAGGAFNLTAINADEMRVLADILTDQNPEGDLDYSAYYPNCDVYANVVRNMKAKDNKRYVRAEIYPDWHTVLQPLTGAPGGFGTLTQSGRCETPVAFQANKAGVGIAILSDVVALAKGAYGGGNALQGLFNWYKPEQIPATAKGYINSGKYAFTLELQKRSVGGALDDPETQCKPLRVTTHMVQAVDGVALVPENPAFTVAAGGASAVVLPGATGTYYYYKLTVLDASGESTPQPAQIGRDPFEAGNGKNKLSINHVANNKGYNVYRAKGDSNGPTEAYSLCETLVASVANFDWEDDCSNVDTTTHPPTVNTTGAGQGKVVITPGDLRGTGWTIDDTDGEFFAFVHYLYKYTQNGQNAKIIDDGLYQLGRWQKYVASDYL